MPTDQKTSQLNNVDGNVADTYQVAVADPPNVLNANVTMAGLAQYVQAALSLVSQTDLANLAALPDGQSGTRSISEIVTRLTALGYIGGGGGGGATAFSGLSDVFNPAAELAGDIYVKDGAGHLVPVPFSVWSSLSAMTAWVAGSGGTTPLLITTTALPPGVINVLYTSSSAVMSVQGGREPVSWGATGLPAGVTINASTGAFVGTPTASGTFSVVVTATDLGNRTNQATLSMVIAASVSALALTMPALSDWTVGTATTFSLVPYVVGGNGAYHWFTSSLPNLGVKFDTDGSVTGVAGTLYGTPNASGAITVAIQVYDTPSSTVAVTSCSESGTTATFNTTAAHGLVVNDYFQIAGVTPAGYNGFWKVVTRPSTTQVTAVLTASGLGVGTVFGTIGKVARVTGSTTLTIDPAPSPTTLVDAFHASALNAYGREPITPLATNTTEYNAIYTAAVAAGHIFYVSPTGDDTHAGAIATPFKTIAHALAQSGRLTVVCRNGTYREAVNVATPVTIMSYPGEYGWVTGLDTISGFVQTFIGYSAAYDMTKLNRLHTLGQSTTIAAGSNGVTVDSTPRTINVASTAAAGFFPAFPASGQVAVVRSGSVIGTFAWTGITGSTFTGCTVVGTSFALATGDTVGGGNAAPFAFMDNLLPASNLMAGYPDQVFFDGRPLKMVAALASVTPGTFTFWIDVTQATSSLLVISENPTGHVVEITTRPTMFTGVGGGGLAGAATGSKFWGLGVYGYSGTFTSGSTNSAFMVVANGLNNVELHYMVFAYNGNCGWTFNSGSGHIIDNCIHIYQGVLHGHGFQTDNLTISDCRFQYGNNKHLDTTPSSFASIGALKAAGGNGWTVIRNLWLDNDSNGAWWDVSQQNTLFACNRVQRNTRFGVNHEVSPTFVAFNNIITDNGAAGIKCADTATTSANSGALLWNNTLVGNGVGSSGIRSEIFLLDDARTTWLMNKTEVYNNVMVAANSSESSLFYTSDQGNANSAPKMLGSGTTGGGIDSNFYIRLSAYPSRSLAQLAVVGGTNKAVSTLAALRTNLTGAVGAEANATLYDATTNLLTEVFTNPATGDYSLTGTVLASAPTLQATSATLIARINAHMGSSVSAFTPTLPGASDATGTSAGIGAIPVPA